ncbi:MAG: SAM-dependent DNA methyltransferase, partial [Chloroflexota bacterium]|nr:SAM-dependent DNA methyltransferase [Chloroflexota bacterium]
MESEELRARLERMERGALFREEFRIRNFLEGDFFGWYLKAWTPDIEKQIRSIVEKLSNYDPTTLEVSPEQTRDLLKKLYHYLMPRELRHDLGEYYTPDWLAERLLTQVDSSLFQPLTTDAARRQSLAYAQKNLLKLRFLDPACGSGTFIVLTIRRIRDLAQRLRMESSNEKKRWVLEAILNNVQGIDLNPLAVIAARTNYILALGDLMQILNRPEIDIPIYLADSILTPSLGEDIFTGGNYRIKTTVGEFLVPEAFNTKDRIDALAHALDEAVEAKPKVSADNFVARVNVAAGLSDKELEKAHRSLADLYKKLSELHSKGLNGVWARIIKNAFMPLFIGKFDYVVGNPPWVNWESLPGDYRQDT